MIADIFNMVINLAMFVIFLRFMLQFAGMGANNPLISPIYQATQVVDLFGRIFPPIGGGRISLAAIVLLFLFKLLDITGNAAMFNNSLTPLFILAKAVFGLIIDFFVACEYLIFAAVIVSWIVVLTNSMHPILGIIMHLAEPILAPFRRIVPNLGAIDLSAIVAIFSFMLMSKGVTQIANYILPLVA